MILRRRDFLRTAGPAALGMLHMWHDAFAAGELATSDMSAPGVGITWVGASTMVISFGDLTILTDPALGRSFEMGDPNDPKDHETLRTHQRLAAPVEVNLEAVDLVLLSHAHIDHFDQQAELDVDRSMRLLLPAADEKALAGKGFENLEAMNWGETLQIDAGTGKIRITAVPAHHSKDPATARALGLGNGYWAEFSRLDRRWTMYWTGDTMPTDEVIYAVRSFGRPDLMVPHVGGVGVTGPFGQISMGANDVVALAAAVCPAYVLPIHHSTYAFYREPIEKLSEASEGQQYRLDVVRAGGTVRY